MPHAAQPQYLGCAPFLSSRPAHSRRQESLRPAWIRRALRARTLPKPPHNGDIVVALLESSDATLKRFFREGDNIRLQPSNAAMKPIIASAASVEIQGRVIGVLRKY